jgi:hypothetical protein
MRHWRFWDWVAYFCVGVAAVGLALGTALHEEPIMFKTLPTFMMSPKWSYLPLILFAIGSLIFVVRAISPLIHRADDPFRRKTQESASLDWRSGHSVLGFSEARKDEYHRAHQLVTEYQRRIDAIRGSIEREKTSPNYASLLLGPSKKDELEKLLKWQETQKGLELRYFGDRVDDLHYKLLTGELVARGFLLPVTQNPIVKDIPKEYWRFLRLTNDFTEASGKDISYTGVEVAVPKEVSTHQ